MLSSRAARISGLLAPIVIIGLVGNNRAETPMFDAAAITLSLLGCVLYCMLAISVFRTWRNKASEVSPIERVDVLTASGAAMAWTGAAALVLSQATGWASLSVLGVLGIATVYLSAIWTALVANGERVWARTVVTHEVVPAQCTEGDPLREEIRIEGLPMPLGMRLFVLGRVQRHGVQSRYVLDARDSGRDVKLQSELGSAFRGEHTAPPLAMWFGDLLGLTRTATVHRGKAAFTVLPRPALVDGAKHLLGAGGDDALSRPVSHAPTEGSFRIREYAPGDDARRIHWVRSLQQDQLVMRMPDEVPPAEPSVRLILDCELFGTSTMTCRAPDDMLDVLVRVWLGLGKALVATGTRVQLVTVVDGKKVTRPLAPQAMHQASRHATRIAWQTAVSLEAIVDDRREKQIIVSSRPRRVPQSDQVSWVVVPEGLWTSAEPYPDRESSVFVPHPFGAAENRPARRERERQRKILRVQDHALFSQVTCWTDWTRLRGEHVARPHNGRVELGVIL